MRRHAVMRHGAPGMVPGGGLREPDVAGITGELSAFEGANDGVAIADFASGGVHEISAALHLGEQFVVEEALGFRMERCVDRDDVADLDRVLGIRMPREVQLFLDRLRQPMPIEIVQVDVERLQTAQHRKTDAAGCDGADMHPLDIVGTRHAVRDVPAAVYDSLVGRDVVADQPEDHHGDVLGDLIELQ
jgi:hypothetical protein